MFKTQAAVLKGPYEIELFEKTLECGDDDIIVKNHLIGICGSDKNFYRGHLPEQTAEFRQKPEFPFLLGHESGGEVVAVGSKVSEFKVGDKVIAFGWNNNIAEYFKAKAFQLQPVPFDMDMDLAALGEPIACAMYSGLHCEVQLGDIAVVMGGGFAGQIIAQCLRLKGAYKTVVIDIDDAKLEIAKQQGADIIINSQNQDPYEAIMELTDGKGCDLVVEAAGTEESYNMCTKILAHNGKFVFYSWVTEPVTLNISRWHDDGLKFINTCLVHHTWRERYVWTPESLRPVAQGMVDIKPLISKEFPLSQVAEAFEYADTHNEAIKVVIRP